MEISTSSIPIAELNDNPRGPNCMEEYTAFCLSRLILPKYAILSLSYVILQNPPPAQVIPFISIYKTAEVTKCREREKEKERERGRGGRERESYKLLFTKTRVRQEPYF